MYIRRLQHIWLVVILAVLLGLVGIRPIAADGPTTIAYTYDDAGRLIKAVYGDDTTISYAYDAAGNLLTRLVTQNFEIYLPLVMRNYTG
ncbi:MAG: RHS repeat domain-containing protein [Chloroflexota bacterium]|nr:RHS repeat domain-containing protein [Chloroflexota bacterium]